MFVKTDIRKVTIALEKIFYHEVYFELGRLSIIHLFRSQKEVSDASMDSSLKEEEAKTREIISGIESVMNVLTIEPEQVGIRKKMPDINQDAAFAAKARKTVERVQRLRSKIQEKSGIISEHISYSEALSRMGIDPTSFKASRLIKMVFGTVENTEWDVPDQEKFIVAKSGRYVVAAIMASDMPDALQFLKQYGFTDKTEELIDASAEDLKKRENTLKRRLEILDEYLKRFKDKVEKSLIELHHIYKGYEEILKALHMSIFSSKAMFITGWMDIKDKPRLFSLLQKICGDRFVAIISDTRDDDAPVRLRNIKLLRPFELLVKTMGMPANKEIDPTPLTAITYVLMFGLMFGDLGQGLVLVLCGIVLSRVAKRKGQSAGTLGQAGGILIACGISAAICGMLYGSIFSSEHTIPALWFHPIENIMTLFSMTILMGVIFITIGLCVNIVNSFMSSDYTEAFFEKKSLTVLILYLAIVLLGVRYARTHQGPALWEISAFVILPLILFSLRGILGPALFKAEKPHNMAEYVTETCVEILEIFLSMLANTVSFIRVGAFALSHAGLSIVTYTLAAMADPAMKSVGAIIVIIIGNIFIIGFEGLVCGIQSMRLEYYEFFSKFFRGDGLAFSPFTLKTKMSEV